MCVVEKRNNKMNPAIISCGCLGILSFLPAIGGNLQQVAEEQPQKLRIGAIHNGALYCVERGTPSHAAWPYLNADYQVCEADLLLDLVLWKHRLKSDGTAG